MFFLGNWDKEKFFLEKKEENGIFINFKKREGLRENAYFLKK